MSERAELGEQVRVLREQVDRLDEALAEAHAQLEDQTEALQAIVDYVPVGFISPMDDEDSMAYRAIARAALGDQAMSYDG